jgi:hypothetical protein
MIASTQGKAPEARRGMSRRAVLAESLTAMVGLAPRRALSAAPRYDTGVASGPASAVPSSFADVRSSYLKQHRFFSDDSPWNTKLGGQAGLKPVPGVQGLDVGLTSWSPTWGSVVIHFAKRTDPLVPVLFHPETWKPVAGGSWRRSGNSRAVEEQILKEASLRLRYPGNPYSTQVAGRGWNSRPTGLPVDFRRAPIESQVWARIPRAAEPAPDWDGLTVVVQPGGIALEFYAPIKLSSGKWVSEMYSFTDALVGKGIGFEDGRRASMVPCYAGAIREIDLRRGRIDHALAVTAPPSMLTAAFVYPAITFDSNCSIYRGTLPMGTRLVSPAASLTGQPAARTALGRVIAEAAETYGIFVVDTGGNGITIVTEAGMSVSDMTRYEPDLQSDLADIVCRAWVAPVPVADYLKSGD